MQLYSPNKFYVMIIDFYILLRSLYSEESLNSNEMLQNQWQDTIAFTDSESASHIPLGS